MAMTLEELRRRAGTSTPGKTTGTQAVSQPQGATMTLDELRRKAGTTAPKISQPTVTQTAGEKSSAVSYADKLAEEQKKGSFLDTLGAFGYGTLEGLRGAGENTYSALQASDIGNMQLADMEKRLQGIDITNPQAVSDAMKANYSRAGIESEYAKQVEREIAARTQAQGERIANLQQKYRDAPFAQDAIMAGQNIGAMLPSMVVSGITGGLAKSAGKEVAKNLSKAAFTPVFAANVFGGSIGESLNDGASLSQAGGYGVASSALETGIEAMFGGIHLLFDGFISPENLTKKYIKTAAGRLLANKLADMTGEGVEEVASEYIQPFLKRAFYDKNAENASLADMAQAFKGGALVSAILGVPWTAGEYRQNKADIAQENAVKDKATGLKMDEKSAVQIENNAAGITQIAEGTGKPFDVSALPQATQTVQLPNPINAGIMQTAEAGKPFDISKLPQYRQTIQLPNPANAGVNQQVESGKPFDISTLPQAEKKATPAVSRLKEYINTLSETQGKNAQINLNKKHNDSDMTVAQFVENNADASFYKEGKLYYMEKDGKKLPVKKSMYDYAKYLQSAKDINVPGKIDTDTNVGAKSAETVSERYSQHQAEKEQGRYVRQNTQFKQTMYNGFAIEKVGDNYIVWDNQTNQIAVTKPTLKGIKEVLDKWENSLKNRTATVTKTVEENPTIDTVVYGNAKVIGKKGNIDILDSVPDGWKRFDMQTAPAGYEGVTNNKSLFGGERRHALVSEDIFRGPTEKSAIIENRITENTVSTHLEATLNTVAYEKEYGKLSAEELKLYNAGKNGDTDRAVQLADKIVSENNINRLKSHGNDVYLLGITKAEDIAKNKNGVVFTGYLSSKTGQKIFSGIYQDVENSTKGNSVWERMKIPFPKFDISDDISYSDIKGKKFILIDDNVTTGRSFIGLKMFIEENGGTVVDLYAPTKGQDTSEKITVTDETWAEIKADIDGIVEFSKKESIKREISQKGLSEREGQELLKQYKRFGEGKNEQNSRTSYEGNEGSSGSTEKTGRKEKRIENNKKGTSSDVSNSLSEKFAREQAKKAEDGLPESVGAMKADEKNITHMVNEYGEIKPGENPARFVSVPISTDGKDRVAKAIRTIMEAGVTKEKMQSRFEKLVADGVFSHDVMHNKETADRAISYIEKYGFAKTYDNWRNKIDNKLLITADDMAQAIMMYTAAADVGEYDITDILAADIAAMTVNSGQVSQVIRILKKTSPQGRLYYTQKSLEAIQDDINDKYGDKAITIEVPQEMKDAIKNAQTSEELQKATEVMHMHIAKQLPFSWSNFINSWRYLAMLGNTRTQWRNILSNCVSGIAQEWTNFVQTAGEAVVAKTGKKIERTSSIKTTEWQRKQAEADFKAIEKDLYSKDKYRNDTLNAIQKMQNPFDFKGKGGKAGEIVGKGLTWWNDKTNWAMESGDKLFSEPAYKRYYARYLAANKINSEEQLTNKVKLRARAWATKQANESVFRESNALAEWIGKQESQLLKSTNPGTKTAAKLVGGLMPFRNTPLNITKRAFEYTPVGILTDIGWQTYSNKRYGTDYNVTQLINKAAKSFSGTVLIALGYALAKHGILTGGLGDDKEDKMKKQMGQQEYALNTDNWSMTMDWAGAGVMPLFVGAQMYQMTEEESDGFFMAMLDTLANASAPVMETSMMTGLMSAIKDAKYEDDITKAGMTFLASGLGSYIGQFVPTILGQFSRAIDDTSRTAYTNTKGVIRPLAKTAEKMQNKTPFSVWNVPYMDVWGNDEKNFDFGIGLPGRLLYNMLSPGYIEKKSNDKVEKMLMDLYDKTGDTSVLPSNYTTSKKLNGENIRFTDKQFEQYTKEYGQTAYKQIENLIADKRFNRLTDEEKTEAIKKIYSYATVIASEETVKKAPSKADENKRTAIKSGISSYDVFIGKDIADKDGDGNDNVTEAEAISYINKHGKSLTKEQKAALYKVVGTDKGYTDAENKTYVNAYADTIKSISSGMSEAKVREIYESAHEYARAIAKVKAGVDDSTKALENKENALNAGVSPYYIFTGKKKADAFGDENGYTSKDETIAYIESLGLSPTEKAYLFAALGNSNWINPYI